MNFKFGKGKLPFPKIYKNYNRQNMMIVENVQQKKLIWYTKKAPL